ncbi:collagen-binding domain-containing protein [Flaviaesturariibacter amylovorans]|uniref:Choice-of-anchor A domain-containing protein n=1 Tax=Flaviaesturariibacter amylovorans TaxID=1084520 RepID=A0ABP8GXP6_9BACT
MHPSLRNCSLTIVLSLSLLPDVRSQTFAPTAQAKDFNIFTEASFSLHSGTVQGPVAIGTDLILTGNGTVASLHSGTYPTYASNNNDNYGIAIGARTIFTSGSLSRVLRGKIRLADAVGTRVWYTNGGAAVNTKLTTQAGTFNSNPALQADRTQTAPDATGSTGIDVADAFLDFSDYHTRIATWKVSTDPRLNHLTLPAGTSATLTLVANKINYLNVTMAQLTALTGSLTLSGASLSAQTILVMNVDVNGTYAWAPPNMSSLGASAGAHILWNFAGAANLQISGNRALYGTLLAPLAALSFTNNNGAYGQVVVRSITLGNATIRYHVFSTTLPDVPEAIVLPLRSISLTGAYSGESVELQWEVLDEVAIEEYAIERSTSGTDFREIGVVRSSGDHSRFTYRFTDAAPDRQATLVFYRVQVREQNGSRYYSAVRAVKQTLSAQWNLWPNPFADRVHLRYQAFASETMHLRLLNAGGQLMQVKAMLMQPGMNQLALNELQHLAPGIYFVELLGERGQRIAWQRIMK